MVTVAAAQAQADQQYAAFAPAIAQHQAAYLATWDRYWQGLPSHATPPADGAATMADVGDDTPDYEATGWPAALFGQPLYAAIKIDQYVAPTGPGFVVTLALTVAGTRYQRTENTGPATYMAHPWQAVPVLPL